MDIMCITSNEKAAFLPESAMNSQICLLISTSFQCQCYFLDTPGNNYSDLVKIDNIQWSIVNLTIIQETVFFKFSIITNQSPVINSTKLSIIKNQCRK